jgi:Lar family restriction alleviation protein
MGFTLKKREFKPCPFCGGEQFGIEQDIFGSFKYSCATCFTSGPTAKTINAAYKLWNTRHYQKTKLNFSDELNQEILLLLKR